MNPTRTRARAEGLGSAVKAYEAVDYGLTMMLRDAATACGHRPRFVYLSSAGLREGTRNPYMSVRVRVERALREGELPYTLARFDLIEDSSWATFAESLVPQLQAMLSLLQLHASDVRQVRMTRWGHAVPVSLPNLIANNDVQYLHRDINERIFFVNQDNWALPAVENCLLDAEMAVPKITRGLD